MPERPLRWGILGTGNIADQFASGLAGARRGVLAAVGSRMKQAADAFAAKHHVPVAHESYQRLVDDPSVDAVYVALPNAMHHAWTIRALRAGKHVLCEKPLAVTAQEGREMFDAAEAAGRILVEAFMYRSHPLTHAILQKIRSGAIGKVRLVRTSFCFHTGNLARICFSPELGGGAMMDVGCYCVNFARLIAGAEPVGLHVAAHLHPSGVDDVAAGVLQFPPNTENPGILATFTCGIQAQADNTVSVCGDGGYIEIPALWKPPVERAQYTLGHSAATRKDLSPSAAPAGPPPRETFYVDADRPLYALEADTLADSVFDNRPPAVSRQDSIGNLQVLDRLRAQVGLAF